MALRAHAPGSLAPYEVDCMLLYALSLIANPKDVHVGRKTRRIGWLKRCGSSPDEKLDSMIVDVNLVRASNASAATPTVKPSGPTPQTRIADLLISLLGEGKASEGKINRPVITKHLPRMATSLNCSLPSGLRGTIYLASSQT